MYSVSNNNLTGDTRFNEKIENNRKKLIPHCKFVFPDSEKKKKTVLAGPQLGLVSEGLFCECSAMIHLEVSSFFGQ